LVGQLVDEIGQPPTSTDATRSAARRSRCWLQEFLRPCLRAFPAWV